MWSRPTDTEIGHPGSLGHRGRGRVWGVTGGGGPMLRGPTPTPAGALAPRGRWGELPVGGVAGVEALAVLGGCGAHGPAAFVHALVVLVAEQDEVSHASLMCPHDEDGSGGDLRPDQQ